MHCPPSPVRRTGGRNDGVLAIGPEAQSYENVCMEMDGRLCCSAKSPHFLAFTSTPALVPTPTPASQFPTRSNLLLHMFLCFYTPLHFQAGSCRILRVPTLNFNSPPARQFPATDIIFNSHAGCASAVLPVGGWPCGLSCAARAGPAPYTSISREAGKAQLVSALLGMLRMSGVLRLLGMS